MSISNIFHLKTRRPLFHLKFAGALFAALCVFGAGPVLAESEDVSRIEFIKLMAKNKSQSKMIPANAASLSEKELYDQVSGKLKTNGFNILNGKDPEEALTQQEFIRLTYAFSGQPKGKSLFEQKQYLKEAAILSTADVGLTTGLKGNVVQYRGEEDGYVRSEMASPVFMDDRVETDLESMVTFTFDDGSSLSMGEDAVVNITEHVYDPERDFRKTIVKVGLGTVRFKVTKGKAPGSMFQVITPVATAGVRGTEFVTVVGPEGKTRFVGLEGKIETFSRLPNGKEGKHEFVVAGQMHEVSSQGKSSGVQKASAEVLDKVFKATNPKKKINGNPKVTMAKVMKAVDSDFKVGKALGKNQSNGVGNDQGIGIKNKVNDEGENTAKASAVSTAKNVAKSAAKDAAKTASKKAAKDAALMTAKNSFNESVKLTIKTSGNLNQGNPAVTAPGISGSASGGPPCGIPPCGKALGIGNGKGKGKGHNK